MDYVEWCEHILSTLVGECLRDSKARTHGMHFRKLAIPVASDMPAGVPDEFKIYEGLDQLYSLELVEHLSGTHHYWKPTVRGHVVVADTTQLWRAICSAELSEQQSTVLTSINRLSVIDADGWPGVAWASHESLLAELGWDDWHLAYALVNELKDFGLISLRAFIGRTFEVRATYRGVVWETRRGFTAESAFIDDLVAEGETTSVDLKRELHTGTADEKAEFVKDVLSLANTQASGRRWLIVGFVDKTRDYYGPPSPKLTQNHIEQLLARYTEPIVTVKYEVVDFRKGPVGRLEVIREPWKLPYRASKPLGDKKRIQESQVFVRHGSQVEEPSPAELQAIQEEGDRARVRRQESESS